MGGILGMVVLMLNGISGRTIVDKQCQICGDGKVEDEEHLIMECEVDE